MTSQGGIWGVTYEFFFPCFNLWESVSSPHIGQAKYPLTVQPDKLPYAGKSLIVHNKIAFNVKNYFLYASKASIPTSHKSLRSSTKGAK